MKLEGFYCSRLLASANRSVYLEDKPGGELQKIGRIPNQATGREAISFRLKTTKYWSSALQHFTGPIHSINVWHLSGQELLANAERWLFYSPDRGKSWNHVLTLPENSAVRGVLPTGVTEHDETLFVGEYLTSYDDTPRLLCSTDRGDSWRVARTFPESRHIHAVQSDPYSEKLWIATGDTDEESQLGYVESGEYHRVGTGSQRWRTVSFQFLPDSIVWGMDCPYAEENQILQLQRTALQGEPTELHAVRNPIYYAASLSTDEEKILCFSTGCSPVPDSTAPDDAKTGTDSQEATVWMAGSADDFSTWIKLASFQRQNPLFDRLGFEKYSTNAYVFLKAIDSRGLFFNPYNTVHHSGEILSRSVDALRNELKEARQGRV
ncbi:hypothetical protein ACFQJ7_09980 [Halovenus rubra]|uniref:Uncharacterized protein n=2 Tax=Halovenus rubra TaxID=869890 RepID=A0ABD5X5A3_9EURY|nr:hypothetical protein [Halovenus rubra]